MAKSKSWEIPESLRHAYKMAVQRANRRVKSNLKYINEHAVQGEDTVRALVGSFADGNKWATGRMPFSRSNKGRYVWNADSEQMEFKEFKNEQEFNAYMRYLNKWGQETKKGERFNAHPEQIKANYKAAIIKMLNTVKDEHSITLPNGQIPKEILDSLNDLSLEQSVNFFKDGHLGEDMEIAQLDTHDMFMNVETAEDFIAVVNTHIGKLKKYF